MINATKLIDNVQVMAWCCQAWVNVGKDLRSHLALQGYGAWNRCKFSYRESVKPVQVIFNIVK